MKLDLPSWFVALLFTAVVLVASEPTFSAEESAPAGRVRYGWGHGGQGGGPGGGQGFGRGRGRGPGGPMRDDPDFEKDHELFFSLLDHRESIRRTVENIDGGIVTVTESDDTEVAKWIQDHVASMKARVENVRPIHMRDPLFRALFSHTKAIEMKVENTKKGVRVTETSKDAFVAKLIQAHAQVVSLFIKNGPIEVSRNHAVPDEGNDQPAGEPSPAPARTDEEP